MQSCAPLTNVLSVSRALQEVGGSLEETAAEIEAAGGKGIPVACDHAQDEQVRNAHTRQRLDLFVERPDTSQKRTPVALCLVSVVDYGASNRLLPQNQWERHPGP